ncbi:MAG TPA: DNA-binding domain-containing protein [Methyloversatilis sp.]
MSALLDAQRRFAGALRGVAGEAAMLPLLAGDDERNRTLLGIYRGNSVANANAALTLAYPVCRMLTGDEYFDGLARHHWAESPSHDGDLNRYGAGFAEFLACFEPARALPYLPDVARLEWSVHVAASAADATPLGGEAFAGLDADTLAAVRLRLLPGFALHDSPWPVADIWLQHQPEADGALDIDLSVAQCAVIWRDGFRVRVAALDGGMHLFWTEIASGAALGDAWARASAHDAGFDLAAEIERALAAGWLHALDMQGESP